MYPTVPYNIFTILSTITSTDALSLASTPAKKVKGDHPKKLREQRKRKFKIFPNAASDSNAGMQGSPVSPSIMRYAAKVAMSRKKNASALPHEKKLSEKETQATIDALLQTNQPNAL